MAAYRRLENRLTKIALETTQTAKDGLTIGETKMFSGVLLWTTDMLATADGSSRFND